MTHPLATVNPKSPHTSTYDPSRDTVGAIYRQAQIHGEKNIIIGDMTHELARDLVTDINEALNSVRPDGKPFYLMVHEKRDLQMKNAILRRMLFFSYRPYPEDDTTVFWKDPKSQEVRFCWSLPHWSEMINILSNEEQFDPEFVSMIKEWRNFNLKPFGFYWGGEKWQWVPNPHWKDKTIKQIS